MITEREFYIQVGTTGSSMLTTRVLDVKIDELRHHKLGLQYTSTGYGSKIPTHFKLLFAGRWRRVYAVCYSNVASYYVILDGVKTTVTIH